jgi:hypothetical protein
MRKPRPLPLDVELPEDEDKELKKRIARGIRAREIAAAREEAALKKRGICPICRCYRTTLGKCSMDEGHDA